MIRRVLSCRVALALLPLFAAFSPATAQCQLGWLPGPAAPGPAGIAEAVLALPNGDIVAGGDFTIAGSTVVDNVARWDGAAWRAMGNGFNAPVYCLARMPNGDLVAGGQFTASGSQPTSRIARWNGSSWAPIGTGLDSEVRALLVLPNGDLIATGFFNAAGAVTTQKVARWNGTSWSGFGTQLLIGHGESLTTLPNGDLVVAGPIGLTNGLYGVLRWNGTTWANVAGLDFGSSVQRAVTMPNGDLVVSGILSVGGLISRLARWNGSGYVDLAPPLLGQTDALHVDATGTLWASSRSNSPSVARLVGSTWTLENQSPGSAHALTSDGLGRLVVGAGLTVANNRDRAVRRFDGVTWQTLGDAPTMLIGATLRLANGDVVIGGTFTSIGGVAANNVARWNGSNWAPLGLGVDGPVTALGAAPNGELLVGGNFANAGGAPANRIARFDGQVWSTLGAGLTANPSALAFDAGGAVMAATTLATLGLLRFDGTQWNSVPIAATTTSVQSIVTMANGDLALGGLFLNVNGTGQITSLVLLRNGATIAVTGGGTFASRLRPLQDGNLLLLSQGQLRVFDGTTVTPLVNTLSSDADQLPNGDIVAVGPTAALGGGAPSSLYRLRNGAFESFGAVATGTVNRVIASGHGDLFLGGNIETTDGVVSYLFAHAATPCRGSHTIVGSGCSGGAGPVTLRADNQPWVGGTFAATATGMTSSSVAVQLFGVVPTITALPGGAPGCSLFVDPYLITLVTTGGGLAAAEYTLPAVPSLAGQQLRTQVVGVEFDPLGIVRLTSSNALQLVIGAL